MTEEKIQTPTKEDKILRQAAAVNALKRLEYRLVEFKAGYVKVEVSGKPQFVGGGNRDHIPTVILPYDFEDQKLVNAIISEEVNGAIMELVRRVRLRLNAIVDGEI